MRLVHAAPQRSGSADAGQRQLPPVHVCALGHALSQLPQWFGSVARAAQDPLHTVWPAEQPEAHAYVPPSAGAHSGVAAAHVTPHPPQLSFVDSNVPHPVPASTQSA
jgi:hypothetical protein